MLEEYKLSIFKGIKQIVFRYYEVDFPIRDTPITKYDAYKLNIMLSDGLAAILSDRNDIYNTFSGDLLFFGPSEIHHGRILRQGLHKYVEILIPTEYFPDYKSYDALFNDISQQRTNLLSPLPQERALILSLAEKIVSTIKNPSDSISLFSNLIELLEICTSLYSSEEKNDRNQNIPATLQSAIHFIREKFSENIQIADIAAASNCSASYLSRTFKKYLGKSPYCYLTEYRLFFAEKLLRNQFSVTDVASMSGFCDSSVFIKHFKKAFGTTPLKYKELYQENRDVKNARSISPEQHSLLP